jgi:hypothetical protein
MLVQYTIQNLSLKKFFWDRDRESGLCEASHLSVDYFFQKKLIQILSYYFHTGFDDG